MASIAQPATEALPSPCQSWSDIARQAQDFLRLHGLFGRDAVMLVPMAQHLVLARRAWAQAGGWMPRIETTQTLAASLGPRPSAADGQLSFDVGLDRLTAAGLLRSQSWAVDWARRDPRSFDEALGAMVSTAHALARAASDLPPAARPAHWQQARALLQPVPGPGGTERALARIAMEWAAASPGFITDGLFCLQPSAWIVVEAGGADALAHQLIAASTAPCLRIDADRIDTAPTSFTLAACHGFEHEAQCTAAQVLVHVGHGHVPVALVAEDRVLVRRVRALLERQAVPLADETGWKLSTTRAAAQVVSLLRAAPSRAPTNALLDWLKTTPARWPGLGDSTRPKAALEAACRKLGWPQSGAIAVEQLPAFAQSFWTQAARTIALLADARRQPLQRWFAALREALQACGTWDELAADAAGQQVVVTLRLSDNGGAGAAGQTAMTLDEFTAWVDGVLEDASFVPPAARQPLVVITPLSRVALRPFAALVLPGADERHLSSGGAPHVLLNDEQSAALGLPSRAQRHVDEALHFAHAMAVPQVTVFHRHLDGSEPLALSPLVERWTLARQRAGLPISSWADPRGAQRLLPAPVHLPSPSAPQLLPVQMSASACEALRACPYRFHALYQLGLREADELDEEIAKRDYGNWLHAVLFDFHSTRTEPASLQDETRRLLDVAQAQKDTMALSDADFVPYAASFAQLAPRYIAWLHARDGDGAQWWQGELLHRTGDKTLPGMALYGRIDRADRIHAEGNTAVELIDYKTGSAEGLKRQVKQPLEDTQLAFYAALMREQTTQPLAASYVALDGSKGIEVIRHADVADSAEALVRGLSHDLERLRAGAGLPALGEGKVCDFCAARGLCRKDHWAAAEAVMP